METAHKPDWDLKRFKKLIYELSERRQVFIPEDVARVIDKLESEDPEDKEDQQYFEELASRTVTWDLDALKVLIERLGDSLASAEDVIWLINKVQNPDDPDKPYYESLVV